MPRQEKVEEVQQLKDRLQKANATLLAEFRGLKVQEMRELRRRLAEDGAEFRVVKNTLTRLAVKEAELEDLLPLIEGSTAMTFVKDDPVSAAKGLEEISKKYPSLVIKGGFVEGKVIDAEAAKALARVKPREQLLTELAAMMQGGVQSLVFLLSAPLRSLGYAMAAYRQKREEEGPAEAAPATPPEPEPTAPEEGAQGPAQAEAEPTPSEAPDGAEPTSNEATDEKEET